MGSFSWTRAEHTTKRANLTYGDKYKMLVPKEFGGGYIKDIYYDYGKLFECRKVSDFAFARCQGYFTYVDAKGQTYSMYSTADVYGILAYWNSVEGMNFDGVERPLTMIDILKRGRTHEDINRCKGVRIGCCVEEVDELKYPLKFVSPSYNGTYEDCGGRSYGDPNQGFGKYAWTHSDYSKILAKLRVADVAKEKEKLAVQENFVECSEAPAPNSYSSSDALKAVMALDLFCKIWCIDTDVQNDLEFRCNSCDFQTKEKKCLVKCFKCDKLPDYPNFGSMGDH